MTLIHYLRCFAGITTREWLRFLNQRGRFFSALVRPLVWLAIFATGFHFVLGVSIIPPYETYIPYEVYIAPGLIAMILLFNGMLISLSMVYDREMGSMRILMVSPLPRWFLLTAKLLAGVVLSVLQAYAFLVIASAVTRCTIRQELHVSTTMRSGSTRLTVRQSGCTDQHCWRKAPLRIISAINRPRTKQADSLVCLVYSVCLVCLVKRN